MAASKRSERRTEILDVALRIADRDGIDGLTMRKLCAELGLSAPIVYRHFKDKAEIIEGLLLRLMGPEGGLSDQGERSDGEWVRHVFVNMHRELTAHPGMISLLTAHGPLLEAGLETTERTLEALRRMGLDVVRSARAFQVLMAYTLGCVAMARGTEMSGEKAAGAVFGYPRMAESVAHMDTRDADVFLAGLDAVLTGVLPK
jgi:AcrR family transcriptional regulator